MLQEDAQTTPRDYLHEYLWDDMELLSGGEAALVLARTGVLTLLVRWAADNCSLPHPEVGLSCPRSLAVPVLALSGTLGLELP